MRKSRKFKLGGRVLVAFLVAGAAFGIATAVQADIPDNGTIHGCYGKPGTPYKGQLRVRDLDHGEQCRVYENALDWNQTGPTGPTGPTGAAGPTFLLDSAYVTIPDSLVTLITHTVTAGEAGLAILTSPCDAIDLDSQSGGSTKLDCSLRVNGIILDTHVMHVNDSGILTSGETTSVTNMARPTLAVGDVITVTSDGFTANDSNEAEAHAELLFEHVSS